MEEIRQELLRKIPSEKQGAVWDRILSKFPWVLHESTGHPAYPLVLTPSGDLQWEEDTLMVTLARETKIGWFYSKGALDYSKASRILTDYQQRELARRLGYSLKKYKGVFGP